jgi:ParB/RepB/Spo0J family partition protein
MTPDHSLQLVAPQHIQPCLAGNVRREFDDAALQELAASIRAHGLIQPITVSPSGQADVPWQIIAGERRWRASVIAGLEQIPVIVRAHTSEQDARILQILENLQRQDLSLAETAAGIHALTEQIGVVRAAEALGKDKSWVSRHAGIPSLHPDVQALITEGLLTSADTAHDLHTLLTKFPEEGQELVDEFHEPPAYRGAPPSRELIRKRLHALRDEAAAEERWRQEREKIIAKAARPPATEQEAPAPRPAPQRPDTTEQERAQRAEDFAARRQARDALKTQLDQIAHALEDELFPTLGLQLVTDDDGEREWRNADGTSSSVYIAGPFPSVHEMTADEIKAITAESARYDLHLTLTTTQIRHIASVLRGDAPAATTATTPLAEYLRHNTQPAPGERIKSAWLFDQFTDWCEARQIEPINLSEFGRQLEQLGVKKHRLKTGVHYCDLRPTQGTRA